MRLPEPNNAISTVRETFFCGPNGLLGEDRGLCGRVLPAYQIDPGKLPYLAPRRMRLKLQGLEGEPIAFYTDGYYACFLLRTELCLSAAIFCFEADEFELFPLDEPASSVNLYQGAWFDGKLYIPTCGALIDCSTRCVHSFSRKLVNGNADSTLDEQMTLLNRHTVYFADQSFEDFWVGEYLMVRYLPKNDAEYHYFAARIIEKNDELGSMVLEGSEATALCESVANSIQLTDFIPTLSGAFMHKGRLYGFGGNKIYVSAKGHPTCLGQAALFDEKDAGFIRELGEEVTAGCVWRDEPIFFTTGGILSLDGADAKAPDGEYIPTVGVHRSGSGSPAVVGDKLCYFAGRDLAVFNGTEGRVVRRDVGELCQASGAGSDGKFYYFVIQRSDGAYLYAYEPDADVLTELEKAYAWSGFCRVGDALIGCTVSTVGQTPVPVVLTGAEPMPNVIRSMCQEKVVCEVDKAKTGKVVFGADEEPKGGFGPFLIRMDAALAAGAQLKLCLYYDDQTSPALTKTFTGEKARALTLMRVLPQRCRKYRLTLEGSGDYTVYGLSAQWLE